MKKVLSFIFAFLLYLSFCACSSTADKELNNAIEKADELVSTWHNEGYGGCIYKSEYISEQDGFEVRMYMVNARYPSSLDSENPTTSTFLKNLMVGRISDELYPQLVEIFKDLDVSIGFTLSDQNGKNTYYSMLDGETIYSK